MLPERCGWSQVESLCLARCGRQLSRGVSFIVALESQTAVHVDGSWKHVLVTILDTNLCMLHIDVFCH